MISVAKSNKNKVRTILHLILGFKFVQQEILWFERVRKPRYQLRDENNIFQNLEAIIRRHDERELDELKMNLGYGLITRWYCSSRVNEFENRSKITILRG